MKIRTMDDRLVHVPEDANFYIASGSPGNRDVRMRVGMGDILTIFTGTLEEAVDVLDYIQVLVSNGAAIDLRRMGPNA